MLILVSIFDRRTGESLKSIHCEVAGRGEYALFGSYTVRKVLALFPQKLVTSGGNEMEEKNELYRRPGALVSNQISTLSIRCRMGPITRLPVQRE
jgi:hypothetical protein